MLGAGGEQQRAHLLNATLYLAWCGLTALSQTLSGELLHDGSVTASELLTVQAAASAGAWLLLVLARRMWEWCAPTSGGLEATAEEQEHAHAGASSTATSVERHAPQLAPVAVAHLCAHFPRRRQLSCDGSLAAGGCAGQALVAFLNALGMLAAHKATVFIGAALAQVIRNAEVAVSWLVSGMVGLGTGIGLVQGACAAGFVLGGSLLCVGPGLLAGAGSVAHSSASIGLGWAAASAVCFGLRAVASKLLGVREVRPDSRLMLLVVLLAAALATTDSCLAPPEAARGQLPGSSGAVTNVAPTCLRGLTALVAEREGPEDEAGISGHGRGSTGRLLFAAVVSGLAWFGYQWASFAMMARVSPVQHSVLGNTKRAVVTAILVLAFPLAPPTAGTAASAAAAGAAASGATVSASASVWAAPAGTVCTLVGAALVVRRLQPTPRQQRLLLIVAAAGALCFLAALAAVAFLGQETPGSSS